MGDGGFRKFKSHAVKFLPREVILYRRGKARIPPRRVVSREEDKKHILRRLHDEIGHRGRDGTYQKAMLLDYREGL